LHISEDRYKFFVVSANPGLGGIGINQLLVFIRRKQFSYEEANALTSDASVKTRLKPASLLGSTDEMICKTFSSHQLDGSRPAFKSQDSSRRLTRCAPGRRASPGGDRQH